MNRDNFKRQFRKDKGVEIIERIKKETNDQEIIEKAGHIVSTHFSEEGPATEESLEDKNNFTFSIWIISKDFNIL